MERSQKDGERRNGGGRDGETKKKKRKRGKWRNMRRRSEKGRKENADETKTEEVSLFVRRIFGVATAASQDHQKRQEKKDG